MLSSVIQAYLAAYPHLNESKFTREWNCWIQLTGLPKNSVSFMLFIENRTDYQDPTL